MKLSVITINFNNAAGLRKTMESLFNQSFTDYEYIIIDGGSTDDSVDVIGEYAVRINYWVSEADKGIFNAMNKGILNANGEYLLFLNSGDWLADNTILEKVFACEPIADIIYGDVLYIYPEGTIKFYPSLRENELTMANFNRNNRATISHPSSFIKRELFKNNLYDESYKIIADIKFFIEQIIMQNASAQYIPLVISNFSVDGLSSNPDSWAATIKERERIFHEFLPERVLKDYELIYQFRDSSLLKHMPFLNNTTGFQVVVSKVVGFMIWVYKLLRM
ncbi:MAG: glycosyltransferase [Bacteroidales bacterium]|nr:glycosyltransferase [Bacteroidales bacterium]